MGNHKNRQLFAFLTDLKINLAKDWQLIAFFVGVPLLMSYPLYLLECSAKGTKIREFPDAIYLTWITLTTVGYGDLYPVTWWGRGIACFDAACGIILFGLVVYHVTRARE